MCRAAPRGGEHAAGFEDNVPREVKKERLARLIEMQESIAAEKNRALHGQRLEVLVERPAKKSPGCVSGRTRGDKTAIFPGGEELSGHTVEGEITNSNAYTLMAERAVCDVAS